MSPVVFGEAKDVVAHLHCSLDTLDFLIRELPFNDGFTRDVMRARDEAEERLRIEADTERFGFYIVMVERPDARRMVEP